MRGSIGKRQYRKEAVSERGSIGKMQYRKEAVLERCSIGKRRYWKDAVSERRILTTKKSIVYDCAAAYVMFFSLSLERKVSAYKYKSGTVALCKFPLTACVHL